MKITKYVHSCLLVETPKVRVLIDPGRYSWDSHLLNVSKLERLDYIVITHEHSDHYYPPLLQALVQKFPHAPIVTNNDLAEKIKELGLATHLIAGTEEKIGVFETPHEPLAFKTPAPLNIGVHIDGLLTHPGDSLAMQTTRDILALPITADWGSVKASLEKAVKVGAKKVIPIHDWHWHKAAREEQYSRSKELLKPFKIEFIELENGVPMEL